jgi:hypothetical protein
MMGRMIRKLILQEDITNINIYTTNIGVPKYIRKILMDMKRKIKM